MMINPKGTATKFARTGRKLALACALCASAAVPVGLVPTALVSGVQAQQKNTKHILNFRDADIKAMIDDVSMMTGRTFIIDPRVRGNVTIISKEPVDSEAIFDLFLSALTVYNFTAVPTSSGAYKIMPVENAIFEGSRSSPRLVADDLLVAEIFRVKNVAPLTVMNTLKPLVDRRGRVVAHRSENFILVVDYAGNIARLGRIIAEIDKDRSITKAITLENSSASEVANTLLDLLKDPGETRENVNFAAIPVVSSNTLLLKGREDIVIRMLGLAKDLDTRGANKGDIRVVPLKHANAEEMVKMLQEVSASIQEATAAGQERGNTAASRASISFHEATNSLVISANPSVQKTLDGVIRQLDIPRPQVLVEGIIVEVSDNAARELGIQYVLSSTEGGQIPFTATNFSNTAPNILAATGALLDNDFIGSDTNNNLATAAVDSLLGLNGFTAGLGGTSNGTLFGVIFNALQQDTKSNILSTPFLMTVDNKEARLFSGQNIPITTGEALGAANVNAFRTVERLDVGIELKVTPRINDDGRISLEIEQQVSSVLGPIGQTTDFITNERELKTEVVAQDGDIIILGGLLEENEQLQVDKVPLLGDIPVLGRLFRSEGKSNQRTNLMIFLRTTIVRDGVDVASVTDRKLSIVNQIKQFRDKNGNSSMSNFLQNNSGSRPARPLPAPRKQDN